MSQVRYCPNLGNEVSTGSDSDRVSVADTADFVERVTQSLPLPVLTS
jgi:hypothetical protein